MQRLQHNEVLSLTDYPALVEVLGEAFREPAQVPDRMQIPVNNCDGQGGTMLLMPVWKADRWLGVKLVNVFPGNSRKNLSTVHAEFLLSSARTGEVRALIDGRSLTNVRTAAVSALAAQALAPRAASKLLLVGTGSLAPHMVRAHAAVRRLTQIQVWGRCVDRAGAVAANLAAEGIAVTAVEDLETALAAAEIVCGATSSEQPIIHGDWLQPGTHLDLVGSFQPQMREADDRAAAMAAITVDTLVALKESGDLVAPMKNGAVTVSDISLLGNILRSGPSSTDKPITLFKSVGTALADLAVAAWLYEKSRRVLPLT